MATTCPTTPPGCNGGADVIADPLVFGTKGITATGGPDTQSVNNKPWLDLTPNYGGLGVGTGSPNSSDQIGFFTDTPNPTDVLTLTFAATVKLTGVATLFDPGHTPFGTIFQTKDSVATVSSTIKFLLSVDGGTFKEVLFSTANLVTGLSSLNLIGHSFAFMEKAGNPEYYVSAVAYEIVCPAGTQCGNGQVPLPGALPLFATGIGMVGLLGWRRKRKYARVAA